MSQHPLQLELAMWWRSHAQSNRQNSHGRPFLNRKEDNAPSFCLEYRQDAGRYNSLLAINMCKLPAGVGGRKNRRCSVPWWSPGVEHWPWPALPWLLGQSRGGGKETTLSGWEQWSLHSTDFLPGLLFLTPAIGWSVLGRSLHQNHLGMGCLGGSFG